MKIYFNNLNIFTRWKYPYIHQKQLNLLTFQIKSLNICLCSPLVLARLPVKFNNNSTTYREQIIQSNINPGCWRGRGGRVSVCPRKWGSRCPVLGGMTIFTIWHVILQSSDGRKWHLLGKYFLSISRSHSSIILISNKRPSWGGWHQHCIAMVYYGKW